mgnify:CR=1 FL=1
MNKTLTIGIDLDGTVRDFISKLAEVYEKQMGKKPNLPVTKYDFNTHFPFDGGDKEFNHFVYVENPLEIFGYAKELTPGAMNNVNLLCDKLHKLGHRVAIVSKQFGKAKSASLFFLSKTACQTNQVIFVQDSTKKWEHVDIMIDDSPKVLNSKPSGKVSVKFHHEYNKDIKSDFVINDIKELLDDEFLNKILTNDYIDYQIVK